MLVDIMKN